MLQVEHLSLIHRRDLRHLVEDVSFVLNSGDKLAIIGEEGNGKSVLLKALMQDPSILDLSLIHISEPTRPCGTSRMPSSA